MTTTRILVIQLADLDSPGRLAEWLVDSGAEVELVRLDRTGELPEPRDFAAVVCLGGPMNANDLDGHPWLRTLRAFFGTCVTRRVPLLAICLGAQVLATALGGEVEPGHEGPEVGRELVAKRDLGWADPLFADLPLMPDVVQFHHDVITRLPAGAELLASATRYPNQAFRVGPVGYGIQFHIETTPELFETWLRTDPAGAEFARAVDRTPEGIAELHADVEQTWRPFVERFVELARGELSPVAKNLL
ncbi:type 1 glutamine amidotransferase [Actinokineospora spheciospongiae]|uniref:type 1 glutamine amidotransferase n=1 Tax=Actinokineospora spheciospongiae TaxID=909613 RepID=UPI000D70A664|nr:type 1 glutamine amidotransferase [Actinokineospora spheciospongiae]PWW53622.1 GMP synthase-like glutamine amidotransferase [Actinokineospora spheciospongiae]